MPLDGAYVDKLGRAALTIADAYRDAGYEVQTVRLATDLLSTLPTSATSTGTIHLVTDLEKRCRAAGFDYIALGPAGAKSQPWLPDLLAATETVFATCAIVPFQRQRIDGAAIRRSAKIIRAASEIEAGFGNLRFAALANVEPGTPFFPAAYWLAARPSFAIATQAADLAVDACQHSQDLSAAHRRLRARVTDHGGALARVGQAISKSEGLDFLGIDFCPAPYPDHETSIGAALETLTGKPVGGVGTLTAAATLTDAIQSAHFPHTGFCGLFLPVLEDSILATRAAQGHLHISDLLHWSAVCGTGLDTIPLPGDISKEALAALLFDVAVLAVRLNKPLTARLMPLPGKAAGDPVHFDFPYFADSAVLRLEDERSDNRIIKTDDLGLRAYTDNRT